MTRMTPGWRQDDTRPEVSGHQDDTRREKKSNEKHVGRRSDGFHNQKKILSSLKNQDDSYFPIGLRFSILVHE